MYTFGVNHISKSFQNKKVLNDVSYDFSHCGLYFLVGPSGQGKSTLLNIIAGYEKADQGMVMNDNDFKISYIFQTDELLDDLTIEENIFLSDSLYKKKSTNIEKIIDILQLQDLLHRYLYELSGGQRKRVSIARALCYDTDVYLCDEPTESLDEQNGQKVIQLLQELSKNKIVIVVTHDLSLIPEQATVLKIEKGQIVEESSQKVSSIKKKEKENDYDKKILKNMMKRITLKKNKKQFLLLFFSSLIACVLLLIYGQFFSSVQYPNTVNRHIIYVESDDGIADFAHTTTQPIIQFYDYDNDLQHFPLRVYPLHNDLSQFEVIGSRKISDNKVIINQNTAASFSNIFGKSGEDLLGQKISLYAKADKKKVAIDFTIAGIVNEDVNQYCEVYYNKTDLDKLLKQQNDDEKTLYYACYKGSGSYEVIPEKNEFESVYQKISQLESYQIFNIEKAQNADHQQMVSMYKPYYIALCIIYMIFQCFLIMSQCQKEWKYHINAMTILATCNVSIHEMKKQYLLIKIKTLFISLFLIATLYIGIHFLFHISIHMMYMFIYDFILLLAFSFSILHAQRHFKKNNIANLIKESKEIV